MSKEKKIEQCKVLKEGYERYKSGMGREVDKINISAFDSEHFAHTMFGFAKLGSEYYSKCEIDYDKSHILSKIGNLTTKLIELNAKNKLQSKMNAVLSNIQKQLESISREDYEDEFETKKKTLITEIKKLDES